MRFIQFVPYAIFSILIASCVAHKGDFLLINKTKEPISRGLVTVCGQTVELSNIQPGNSASGVYVVTSDSHYDISIEFQSGKKFRKELGYVTNGLDFHHEIVVTDADIELKNLNAK